MSNDPFLDLQRWWLKRDFSVCNKKATLEYQQYTDKNTFIPKQVYSNQSCERCHHNWHCDQSDLFAAQFSSILWWCRVTYMKDTYIPSSYIWTVSYQGFILKQNHGNTKTNTGPAPKTPCIVFVYHKNISLFFGLVLLIISSIHKCYKKQLPWIKFNSPVFLEYPYHVPIPVRKFPKMTSEGWSPLLCSFNHILLRIQFKLHDDVTLCSETH